MCYCGMETAQIGDLCSAGDLNGVITPKCSDNNDVCIMIGAEMKDCEVKNNCMCADDTLNPGQFCVDVVDKPMSGYGSNCTAGSDNCA